jgi:hypothetical protein
MKTMLGILVAVLGLAVPASATDCHRQRVVAEVVEHYEFAPIVEYQVLAPHRQLVVQNYEYVEVAPQRVRVVQKNIVKRPVVVRQRVVQKNVKQRNFSRQRVVERNVQAY